MTKGGDPAPRRIELNREGKRNGSATEPWSSQESPMPGPADRFRFFDWIALSIPIVAGSQSPAARARIEATKPSGWIAPMSSPIPQSDASVNRGNRSFQSVDLSLDARISRAMRGVASRLGQASLERSDAIASYAYPAAVIVTKKAIPAETSLKNRFSSVRAMSTGGLDP